MRRFIALMGIFGPHGNYNAVIREVRAALAHGQTSHSEDRMVINPLFGAQAKLLPQTRGIGCLRRVLCLLLASLALMALDPVSVAAHDNRASGSTDAGCGDHVGDKITHHHILTDTGSWDCADAAFQIDDATAGSEYVTRLLNTELGGYVETFARWAAVVLLIYSVVWMIWPLFQSSRGGGGGEQRKVFKNLVLPLVVAAISFDLSITGTIFDFFIGLVDAAASTFSDIF